MSNDARYMAMVVKIQGRERGRRRGLSRGY
jgi:hypothetical protein